jgi:hypothetical protein
MGKHKPLKRDSEIFEIIGAKRGEPRRKETREPIAECQGDREVGARVVRVEDGKTLGKRGSQ